MPEGGDPTSSMVVYSIEAAAAAPILINDDVAGLIYIDRREDMKPFTPEDCEQLANFAGIFAEFSDLLFGTVG